VHVSRIQLENFRNFESVDYAFRPEGTAIRGDNGRGKSNLLESIFFLAVAKSGRGTKDRDVVRWGAEHYVITAEVEREDHNFGIRVAYDRRSQKKRAFLDESPLERLSDLVGHFNAVLFSPEDVDLVLRDPSERRRLLDILVSQSSHAYLSDLEQYRRILSQRNHLLRTQGWKLTQDSGPLEPWDQQISEFGARVIHQRVAAVDRIQAPLDELYAAISPSSEKLSVDYRCSGLGDDEGATRKTIHDLMKEKRCDEVNVGYTLVGPHRDQVVFKLDGYPVHKFGSKGQMKSVLLAWKMSEARFLASETGFKPVLLMDDIFSELDKKRANAVLDLIGEYGQNVLATARDPDLDLVGRGYESIEL
jgi:DNA replication and repair protein RecF